MTEHIVEMDAMDVAEWEKDRLTPLAPDAKLAALVKESAPESPRSKTVARAPNPPPVKSGPIPRVTPVSMAAVAPPTPPARTTARLVAKKPTAAKALAMTAAPAKPTASKPAAPVKAKRPAPIVEDDLAIPLAAAQTPESVAIAAVLAPMPERVATPMPERVAVAAVHTPMPDRFVAAVHTPVPERFVAATHTPMPEHVAVAELPERVEAAARAPMGRASSVDDDWFGEGTQAAAPLMVEPAPLPPAPEPVRTQPEQVPMRTLPAPEPVHSQPGRIETQNPEYDWTPRPGTAPGPDAPEAIAPLIEERTRTTDSIPAVAARRSRRPLVIFASAASVIAVVAIVAFSGSSSGNSGAASAPAPVAAIVAPAPRVAAAPPVATPEPAVAVAVATPEPAPIVAPAPVKPIAAKRIARGKKVVLEYDHPTAAAAPANDDAAVAQARAAYTTGNQRLFAGDPDGALHYYREALASYPGYVAGYRGLGLAFAKQGDKIKALQALRTYVAAVPNAKDVALINARIARLQKK